MTVYVGKKIVTEDENLHYELPAGNKETTRNSAWLLNLKDCLIDTARENLLNPQISKHIC